MRKQILANQLCLPCRWQGLVSAAETLRFVTLISGMLDQNNVSTPLSCWVAWYFLSFEAGIANAISSLKWRKINKHTQIIWKINICTIKLFYELGVSRVDFLCFICICMLRGSTHYCAIAPRVLSHHIVDFSGFRRMETPPTSIEVLLRPTLVQSDKPSDLRGSLSPTTRHRCTHVLVYTSHGVCQTVTHPIMDRARRCLASVIGPTPMS